MTKFNDRLISFFYFRDTDISSFPPLLPTFLGERIIFNEDDITKPPGKYSAYRKIQRKPIIYTECKWVQFFKLKTFRFENLIRAPS